CSIRFSRRRAATRGPGWGSRSAMGSCASIEASSRSRACRATTRGFTSTCASITAGDWSTSVAEERRPFRPRPFEYVLLVFGFALITRYAWVMDDAFIYARYAENAVVMKLGLVYNAGEWVEGFSSPLWMLWVLLGRALGLGYWTIFLGSGYLFFL